MASSSSDTATLQAQLAEARAEAEKAKKSAMRWKSKHDAVKEATRAAAQAAADLGTEGFVIDEKELLCSVCYQLPPGEVHQCHRGHFLCVTCWNDLDKVRSGRKCPECRAPVPKAARNKVAELAIRYHDERARRR